MRGLQCPEVANGEFLDPFVQLLHTTVAQVMLRLPHNVSEQQRHSLVAEFNAGANHLCFFFVLKLAHMGNAPAVLWCLPHSDVQVAHGALRLVLGMPELSDHPRVRRLQQPPLRDLATLWLEHGTEHVFLPRMAPLATYIGELRFSSCNERPGEGQHAKTHRRGLGKPNHTEQYQSLNLRLPEMEGACCVSQGFFDHMAFLRGCLRNARQPLFNSVVAQAQEQRANPHP